MSDFWDSFGAAAEVAVSAMGEKILWDGEEISAVVAEVVLVEGGAAPGGRKTMVSCKLMVTMDVTLRDGIPVVVRGAYGKVNSWERLSSGVGVMVDVGPVNRWSGEVPGV